MCCTCASVSTTQSAGVLACTWNDAHESEHNWLKLQTLLFLLRCMYTNWHSIDIHNVANTMFRGELWGQAMSTVTQVHSLQQQQWRWWWEEGFVVLHNHLQLSFQSLSLHCRPHYWWSGAGLDLWSEAISGIEISSQCVIWGDLRICCIWELGELHWFICSSNCSSISNPMTSLFIM